MAASQNRNKIPDAEALDEDELQYGHGPLSKEELEDRYPNRPVNHSKTLPFHDLYTNLFNPLNENKKRPAGPAIARAKQGPHGPGKPSAYQERENIVDRFISRWRNEVGSDFYPAIRLIIPDKDRDRPMYGLKEAAIGKILVKVLKLTPKSEDGYNLLHWKLPGQTTASRMAGDFAGRCYEVLKKREMRSKPGDLSIAEVNSMLDRLAAAQGQKGQEEIFEHFYNNMNAEELMWLIRIILRQMKIGASEKTLLTHWHPDGEALFNVSSSLRRVCWELTDPEERLEEEDSRISLMSCFQPQLAQFQMNSFQTMLAKMGINEENPQFWIEEKMDGERMQMHMMEDDSVPGGKRFNFWSRKAKDYTYLYGNGYEDENSALTRHLKDAFHPDVRNIILDGEMITWDPEADIMVPFGTLKTAALSEQRNPYQGTGPRPLFRVFDMLFLNDTAITKYELRDRRKALEKSVNNVHRRLEIHEYQETTKIGAIDPRLREIVAEGSEGLVLKNPRSAYRLSERNNDWMKVKPEYMEEFGESLDCVVIGGYYGSGHRGGRLSSFLCGLRTDPNRIQQGDNPEKCYSFFKVGGGFRAEDYAEIKHRTDGLWTDWDRSNPPRKYICLGGGEKQFERPDVWIRPSKSVVISAKAASVGPSESFGIGLTLRFPRFKKLRTDKSWDQALDISEFLQLKDKAFAESKEKQFKVDDSRRNRTKKLKREKNVQGNDITSTPYAGPQIAIFEGLNFFVATDMTSPIKKSKGELEQIIKANGGAIYQGRMAQEHMIVIGDKKVIKVASLIRHGVSNIVRGKWILDCLKQAEIDIGKERYLIPFEPGHMFHTVPDAVETFEGNVDGYGDSYARDVDAAQLRDIMKEMNFIKMEGFDDEAFLEEVEENGHHEFKEGAKGWLFKGCIIYIPSLPKDQENNAQRKIVIYQILFASGKVVEQLEEEGVTHVVIVNDNRKEEAKREETKAIRRAIADLMIDDGMRIPRIVGSGWVAESLREGTLLDEERYSVLA